MATSSYCVTVRLEGQLKRKLSVPPVPAALDTPRKRILGSRLAWATWSGVYMGLEERIIDEKWLDGACLAWEMLAVGSPVLGIGTGVTPNFLSLKVNLKYIQGNLHRCKR